MTPLDDARTLFGADALTDRTQLRRAYARLVKAHPPDSDPEMFQRVRAAYDAAKQALENPDAQPVDHGEALTALIEALTPESFDADLTRLEAMMNDSRGAALTALFLVHATRPESVLAWLTEVRQRGLSDDALLTVLTALLEMRPDLGLTPISGALTLTLPPPAAATLDGHRIRAGIREDDTEAGFALWRDREAALRTHDPATWLHVADAILFFAADRAPSDVLDDIEVAIEDVGLDADEQAHTELVTGLRQARTLAALQADERVPETMVDALRRGQRTSAPGLFSALRQMREDLEQLGGGSLSEGMHVLAIAHPHAYEMLRDIEARLTGKREFYRLWAEGGAPPHVPDGAMGALLVDTAKAHAGDRRRLGRGLLIGLIGAYFAVAVFTDLHVVAVLALAALGAAVARFAWPWFEAPISTPSAWLSAMTDAQHTFGLWRHEVIAALDGTGMAPSEVLDALFDDDEADLRCLSAAHGFRSTLAWQADDAADTPTDTDADPGPEERSDEHAEAARDDR